MQRRVTLKAVVYRNLAILTLLVAAIFGNTLGHGFVWDDTLFVPDGEVYRNFDIRAIFFSLKANGLEYLPVRDLSYALDCALWKDNPAGYHFSNLLIFWLTILAIYFFVHRLAERCGETTPAKPHKIAFLTAALFTVHPIHSEVVSFITCRNVLLSGLFLFLACTAWLNYLNSSGTRRAVMYAAALLCFTLSLFSKATGIILPLILFCITWMTCRTFSRRHLLELTPFFILSGSAYFLFTTIARKTDVFLREPYSATMFAKIVLAVQIPFFYLEKLIIPCGFSADYGTEQFSQTLTAPSVGGALLLVLLSGLSWRYRNSAGLFAFAFVWFLIALIPALHLFPTLPVVADRYAFLPSFGCCFLVALAGAQLQGRRFWFAAAPLVLVLAVLAWRQNLAWKNDTTLWESTLAASPRSTTALAELGRIFFWEERNVQKAMAMYRRSSEIDPSDPAFDIFQGHLSMMKKDFPNAVAAFRQAVAKDEGNIEAVLNLGRAYQSTGELERAREQYRRAASLPELDPRRNMRGRAMKYLQDLGS